MEHVQKVIQRTIKETFGQDVVVELTRPDQQFGDFATSVALKLASSLHKSPRDIAETLVSPIAALPEIASVDVAGPGFINIRLSDQLIISQLMEATNISQTFANQSVVAEYSDPNPFKILHAGHLYTSVVGDAMANLLAAAGAEVHRVNFGGDVGLHVGKTMWAILQSLGGELPEELEVYTTVEERTAWLASCYIAGTEAYETDEMAKVQIIDLNKRVYQLHADHDKTSAFAQIYWTTRQWSYDYFDAFYARIGTKFEKYYPESQVAELGLVTVREHIEKGVFEQSDGAIIFRGEDYGLHTRVFINREGLPTYEAKDVGLIFTKKQDYNFDLSVVITGNEQEQYMAVVLKAVEQFAPELVKATKHLTHGIVKLSGGEKMSSRKGNILRAVDVLEAAKRAHIEMREVSDEKVELGAIKYAFLKVRTGGDIIYDPNESMSLEGNSGPYLQYAYARASSIMRKAVDAETIVSDLTTDERTLALKISQFREVGDKAVQELSPHLLCTYLYELTQAFNRFYEHNRVIDDPRQSVRLTLLKQYRAVLGRGLRILGIAAPEKM